MRSPRAGAMPIALCLSLLGCSGCFIECEEITLSHGQSADGVYGATASYIDCGAVSDSLSTSSSRRRGPCSARASAWGDLKIDCAFESHQSEQKE